MWRALSRASWNTGVGLGLMLLLFGCGSEANLNRAQTAVSTALEQWKSGSTPQQLSAQAISMADPDWSAGYRLLEFQFKQRLAPAQQGPRVVVQLQLQDRRGRKVQKEVAYEVLLGENVRIGRDAFHTGQ